MQEFLDILDQVNRSAYFSYFLDEKAFLPGIEIKALNEQLALPLSKSQAPALISVARQAPYGKSEKTLVNTKVHKCWEIDESDIVFHDKAWTKMIDKMLHKAEKYFDIEDKSLEAHIYKLLPYEKAAALYHIRPVRRLTTWWPP